MNMVTQNQTNFPSVEPQTLEIEVQGSKPAVGTWRRGRIPPNQPYTGGCQVLELTFDDARFWIIKSVKLTLQSP